jgi:hypothetical protein
MNQDIKDIKPPIDIPSQWSWLWIVLVVLVVIGLIVGFIWWFRQRPQIKEETVGPVYTVWDKAYARLEHLRLKKLIERAYLKPFYSELCDIVRHYLEERFLFKAPEMTTEEFLGSVKTSGILNEAQKELLKEFLFACDMVKFAKHESNMSEAQRMFDLAKQLVDQTRGI